MQLSTDTLKINGPDSGPFALQTPQKVSKLMDNINKLLCGGLEPSVCL